MKKLIASIKKEWLILLNDKVGLLLMYGMPILLVFVITLVQDSTFKLVNENKIDLLVVNNDKGTQGDSLIQYIENTGGFDINLLDLPKDGDIQSKLLEGSELIAVKIPEQFSESLEKKASQVSSGILSEFDIAEKDTSGMIQPPPLKFFYDPVIQENFRLCGNIIS